MLFENKVIISGGQSGVDRAALDFAIKFGIKCGGWCPKGRLAEDGIIDFDYPLRETKTSDYSQRTKKNISNSDATLIIANGKFDTGTKLTYDYCIESNKPVLVVEIKNLKSNYLSDVSSWIRGHATSVINIAGPRESSSPGIYSLTTYFLRKLLIH